MVPGYNLALAYAQANGVSASVASLTTALNPLFTMILSVLFLKEKIHAKHFFGLSVAFLGMITIGSAERPNSSIPYSLALVLVSAAPLSWAVLSVATKAVSKRVSPILWTFLSIGFGGAMLLPFAGKKSVYSLIKLDQAGWLALSYLIILCTVVGFATWIWLLQNFSATSMGFTVFLNPPLTALSKMLLSVFFPAVFIFQIQPREWIGGALVLLGMAFALARKGR
jgi:drug/metabolite transporter (DMT)-like permease